MTVLSFKYAYRNVRAGFGRMALSIVAIALGVALVVAFQLMNAAVLQSFLDTIDAMAGRAQLIVSAGDGLSFSEDVLEKVRAVPGVKLAVPLVRSTTFPDDGSGEMLTVQGVDLTNESAIRVYHDADQPSGSPQGVIDDMVEFLNSPDSVILGREFADKRNLKKGDTLGLVTPQGVRTFTIKALLDAQGLAQTLRGRLVVMDLFAAQRAFTADRQINQIDILLDAPGQVEPVMRHLEHELGSGLRVEEPVIRKQVTRKAVAGFQAMVSAFSLLAIIAGLVICFSRLSTVFATRTWEVGVLRAIGLTRQLAFAELLKEAALLGSLGTGLGVGIGFVVGTHALPFFAATTAIAFRMPPPAVQSVASAPAIWLGAAVGITAAVAAALLPAYRLATTLPIAALRLRGREVTSSGRAAAWLGAAMLLAASCTSVGQHLGGRADLGHLTTVLFAIAVLLLATPVVRLGGRVITPLWWRGFGPTGGLAICQLARGTRRAGLTVAVLGLGLGIVLTLDTLEWSFERTLVASATRRIQADLVLTSSRLGAGEWGGWPLSGSLLPELRRIPGIAAVGAERSREVAYAGGSTVLAAFDRELLLDARVYRLGRFAGAVPDAVDRLLDGDGVFVSRAFAGKHRVSVGDPVTLPLPTGVRTWPILAISDGPFEAAVVLGRDTYRRLWGDSTASFIYVALDAGVSPAAVETAIARGLGVQHRLQIQSRDDLVDYFATQVRQAFAVQYLVALAVLALVSLSVGDALASSVSESTREYGILRAVGLSRRELLLTVLLEGSAIGVLGLVLALMAGVVLGAYWVYVEFPAILGWRFEFHFPFRFAAAAFFAAFLMCLLGAITPALRAARMPAAVALRDE